MTTGDQTVAQGVRSWTELARPPLVGEVVLHLAEDIHRTWERLDEELPPFWAFAWAGGQALARYVLDHPDVVRGRRVLDLAAGSGLVGIAAARAGAASVVCSETDARAVVAIGLNAAANGVTLDVVGDVVGQGDGTGDDADDADGGVLDADVVLAGDVFYEQPMARHMARFCDDAVGAGLDVLVGDPGREYLPRRRCTAVGTYDVAGTADLESAAVTPTTVWRFG